MLTEAWLQQQIEEIQREAREACARSRCREFGDCDPACKYFWATASQAEKEEARRAGAEFAARKKRLWDGPREPVAPEQET